MAKVYWTARDLSSFFWGNHQFILITFGVNESSVKTKVNDENGTKFIILAGHQPQGNLIFLPNEPDDVKSVREFITPSSISGWSDFDLERHSISPPTGGGLSFANKLEELAYKYESNTKDNPVDYDLWDRNCATWVNTLLKVANVPESERKKAGEFNGIDWGEEDLLDENLFK